MSKEKFVVVSGKCRCSFLSVFQPKVWDEGTEGKYEGTFIFDSQDDIKDIVSTVKAAIKAEHGDNVPDMPMPWKKGDDCVDKEGKVRDGYEGKIVIRASSKFQPVIIDQNVKVIEDLDSDKLQSGDYVKVKLEAYCWEYAGKKGVTLYLKAIQLVEVGERFGGGANDTSGFDVVAGGSGGGDLFI